MKYKTPSFRSIAAGGICLIGLVGASPAEAAYHFSDYTAHPPIHISSTTGSTPIGMTPTQIKSIYNLPASGGTGTIVIVGAYNEKSVEKDLADFDATFKLPACTAKNGCFKKHLMSASTTAASNGWQLETALDVEWAHAIAPQAKILLVEAKTPSGANLVNAVQYAAKQKDARAISMSWGGKEFPEEKKMDANFKSVSGAPFFAASGDSGAGVSWPAASPNVIAVGGTSLTLNVQGALTSEQAWSGSGGGISAYEAQPAYQKVAVGSIGKDMRTIPDVAYDADLASGFPIVHNGVWQTAGGTSAGAPQWAAIAALGKGIKSTTLYADAVSSTSAKYFRDIVTGANGSCGTACSAHAHYDFVTGNGTPQTATF